MEHWDSLYPDEILTVEYELLVADLQGQTQRMCDYLDLALEPECLAFYQSKRVVHTLSNQQVRQPIFKNGIDRWRNYEFALSDFITD